MSGGIEEQRYGWLEVRLNLEDSRIRLYKLKGPEEAVKEMKSDRQRDC